MDSESSTPVPGSDSQDSNEPAPPGTGDLDIRKKSVSSPLISGSSNLTLKSGQTLPTSKGVENAKKRLRAFSIQKKATLSPMTIPKPVIAGNTTVLIGKLSSNKITPKSKDDDPNKLPKPPKPGKNNKYLSDSYSELQKKTLAEIEDMKRKMELVDLGIPLGLICPTAQNDKAMPTKAMPPIKSLLDPSKVDEIIREAKKAKAEGREFKFDYQKLLPDYDNPFQRKKDEAPDNTEKDSKKSDKTDHYDKSKDRKKTDRHEYKKHYDYRRVDKDKYRDREKYRSRDKEDKKDRDDISKDREVKKEKDDKIKIKTDKSLQEESLSSYITETPIPLPLDKETKETNVNLNDYLVCDSWSLENDDKTNSSSPQVEEKTTIATASPIIKPAQKKIKIVYRDPMELLRDSLKKRADKEMNSPQQRKIEKLQPVDDTFEFEIDPNEEVLDILDDDSDADKYSKIKPKRGELGSKLFGSHDSKDVSMDGMLNDDFLESVINELKQEDLDDDVSQDKGLVEYDSPEIEDEIDTKDNSKRDSVTPELKPKSRDVSSRRSDYSDGYKSTESGYKSTESGFKSSDEFRLSVDKELDASLERNVKSSMVDSLETWSFVLKICQPLLFRHDKNKCYKETRTSPKLWFAQNPKLCNCVKDRAIVYEELEMCKMSLVDAVYGCDQITDAAFETRRSWYPRGRLALCASDAGAVPVASEWEIDEPSDKLRDPSLDNEYKRFMNSVWPKISDAKSEPSRSNTPVREDVKKKGEDKKRKTKLSSEGWSQESEVEEEPDRSSKKLKVKEKSKSRKRRRSSSSTSSDSDTEEDVKKDNKHKKKISNKKTKAKLAKKRKMEKKYLKKLKEKQKKKKKREEKEMEDIEETKKERKAKKRKQQKIKKRLQKKRSKKSSSSSDSSSSSSESEPDRKKKRTKQQETRKKKKKDKKKRKQSTSSESSQSEELFDVNILNNIKTEKVTDDEKKIVEFSPRWQQTERKKDIINVIELQSSLVESVNVKVEKEDNSESQVERKRQVSPVKSAAEERDVGERVSVAGSQDIEVPQEIEKVEFKEPKLSQEPLPQIPLPQDPPPQAPLPHAPLPQTRTGPKAVNQIPTIEESQSQCSSQDSLSSLKGNMYEKDASHLRPSSQNSNYNFNDVISASQNNFYSKGAEMMETDKFEGYEENYEMYEQMAMAYQSDVANQEGGHGCGSPPGSGVSHRIETVVAEGGRGEIKCDWRVGDSHPTQPRKPSRWGLKPGEVNIVLTGGGLQDQFPIRSVVEPVYKIQSLANRDVSTTDYDEAYMDMYGAADRLQYGDCFATAGNIEIIPTNSAGIETVTRAQRSSLDARIDLALKNNVLGGEHKEVLLEGDKEIIASKPETVRGKKSVSFADGYKPGQDSDTEEPPKKRKRVGRVGCAWPCPSSHADHVPLWDALPPPPPPPGSPPPPATPRRSPPPRTRPAPRLLSRPPPASQLPTPPHHLIKFHPNVLPGVMPPEPSSAIINLLP